MEKKNYEQSKKLDNVCYDIRGPVMDEAMRMEARGANILKLNIGNPAPFGFYAPDEVILDMIYNLRNCEGYSDSRGLFSARKAIMQYCQLKGIPNVGINDIFTGNGVSELITLTMQGLLDDGDEILVPAPDYPLWTASITLAGGKAVHYLCDEQQDWYPDINDLRSKVTPRTKGIVVINPNNPTGALYPKEILEQIVQVARERPYPLCRRDLRPSRHAGRTGAHRARLARARPSDALLQRPFQIPPRCGLPRRLGVSRR